MAISGLLSPIGLPLLKVPVGDGPSTTEALAPFLACLGFFSDLRALCLEGCGGTEKDL